MSLPTLRCAQVCKVGVLRATLTLRCYASLRTADAPSACLTQEISKTTISMHFMQGFSL
ncbi:MAG: hypothetical protein NZ455_12735 [Bacteroidia bacterium]|nr:hypothetical protein [Bacteroidia bacterium]MDW8346876.1 hypothetical protein [Bacteroidia bacterium]